MRKRNLDLDDDVTIAQGEALGGSRPALRRQPTVHWTDAQGPHTLAVVSARTVIGSATGVDLIIADPAVSRLHAELELRDDGLWINDLGSRNGTFVEGVRVGSAQLPDGGRARMGSTELRVEYPAAPQPVEAYPHGQFGPLIGQSLVMRELFSRLARIAPTDSTVLIQGETGTGKELVAQAIHTASQRAQGPFVVVDCAALPEHLLEAELFGHTRGAFTGAVASRAGAIESAEGGTVFLDEVGELPLPMQPKLLRVLESRTVRRIGETAARRVNVRFLSATHRDLRTMVNAGTFREDLYFRLAVLPIGVPALRARASDIPLLVSHFLPASQRGALPPDLLRELQSRSWMGNVRELRNFVERAVALGTHEALSMVPGERRPAPNAPGAPAAQPTAAAGPAFQATTTAQSLPMPPVTLPFKDLREQWLDHLEREYFRALLAKHNGNIVAVSNAAGVDRTYVYRLLRKHDLDIVRPSDKG